MPVQAAAPPQAPEAIAQLVLDTYAFLPRNVKPTLRSNGVPEWTILAALVLSLPPQSDAEAQLRLVSLGTGMKCLPTNRLPPCGDTLHDSHAEVLARRGFGRFLVQEAISLSEGTESRLLERHEEGFRLRIGIEVHLYISALPCGNASTLYTAAHQPLSMAALKSASLTTQSSTTAPGEQTTRGRNGYTNTCSLRTKPGRPDSFPSISMSCSDKIASWCVLGLLGGLLARWFEPVYLDSVIIGGTGDPPDGEGVVGWPGTEEGWSEAIKREAGQALYGRLESIAGPYRLARPVIHLTNTSFPYDQPSILALHPNTDPAPHPSSALHYLAQHTSTGSITTEHLQQGCDRHIVWKPPGSTPIPVKRRSGICKLEMLRAARRLEEAMVRQDDGDTTTTTTSGRGGATYFDCKQGTTYQFVKSLLRGTPGEPRIIPGFEKCGPLAITAPPEPPKFDEIVTGQDHGGIGRSGAVPHALPSRPPFAGWIVSGRRWESFDLDGTQV